MIPIKDNIQIVFMFIVISTTFRPDMFFGVLQVFVDTRKPSRNFKLRPFLNWYE